MLKLIHHFFNSFFKLQPEHTCNFNTPSQTNVFANPNTNKFWRMSASSRQKKKKNPICKSEQLLLYHKIQYKKVSNKGEGIEKNKKRKNSINYAECKCNPSKKRKLWEQKVTVGFKHLALNWTSNKACKR